MPVLQPKKPTGAFISNVYRDGWNLLLEGAAVGAAQALGFKALPTTGIIELGAADGIELVYLCDASSTDCRVRVTGLSPVWTTTSPPVIAGYFEYNINSEVATNAVGTVTAEAAMIAAVGSTVIATSWLYVQTPATSAPMTGLTAYAGGAAGTIGYLRLTPAQGLTHVRVQATAITGGTKVAVLCRRVQGASYPT